MSLIRKSLVKALFALLVLSVSTNAQALSGGVSANYSRGFEPSDPYVFLNLSLSEKLNKSFGLSLNQDINKNLIIDSENDEYVFADTRIGLRYALPRMREDFSGTLSFSLTLPVSKKSQHSEIYSMPQITLASAYKGVEGLEITASAFFRDVISAYETTPAEDGSGGQVLPDYLFGLSHGSDVSAGGFGAGYSVSYVETHYHKQERSASEANDFRANLPSQGYSISLFVSRDLWTKASLSLSYNQGTALVQEGYEDYVIFDSAESTYSIGFSQSF